MIKYMATVLAWNVEAIDDMCIAEPEICYEDAVDFVNLFVFRSTFQVGSR